ncbi:MAG: universal stress protein [Gammaproteobacteria bacterium]|jgi:nucleotide-binding universal stress UspA family protein|nr:universal stress protein [Gammaproteobacteria bacterium]
MNSTAKLNWQRILVVIPPERLDAKRPADSPLIERALRVARQAAAGVELFTVCHENSLEQKLFAGDAEVEQRRQELADTAVTRLDEIGLAFKSAGLSVKTEALWHADATDAILHKVATAAPDLVMAESQEHNYILGISANTDWTLVRHSSSPVWFVSPKVAAMSSAMTAIGSSDADDEIVAAHDYHVFEVADQLTKALEMPNTVVHAYQVPVGVRSYVGYAPYMGPMTAYPAADKSRQSERRREAAIEHGRMVRKFADHFDLDADDIELVQGLPADVLPSTARKLGVELVIMGARNLSRWQRVTQAVAAEPVLAEAECDVLFVKDPTGAEVPKLQEQPVEGAAEFDVEAAVLDPRRVFGTPAKILEADHLSAAMQKRLLTLWRQDIVAEQAAVNEGIPAVGRSEPDGIRELDALLEKLEQRRDDDQSVAELLARSRAMVTV